MSLSGSRNCGQCSANAFHLHLFIPSPTSNSKGRVIHGLIKDGSSKPYLAPHLHLGKGKKKTTTFNFASILRKIFGGFHDILSGGICHGRSSTWPYSMLPQYFIQKVWKSFSTNSGYFLFINEVAVNSIHLVLSLYQIMGKGHVAFLQ